MNNIVNPIRHRGEYKDFLINISFVDGVYVGVAVAHEEDGKRRTINATQGFTTPHQCGQFLHKMIDLVREGDKSKLILRTN